MFVKYYCLRYGASFYNFVVSVVARETTKSRPLHGFISSLTQMDERKFKSFCMVRFLAIFQMKPMKQVFSPSIDPTPYPLYILLQTCVLYHCFSFAGLV